jgi:hypothetical protein
MKERVPVSNFLYGNNRNRHIVDGKNTSCRHLLHLMLENWYMKFIYLFSGTLYNLSIGLYHPLDGITNLKFKLLCF